MKKLNLGYFPSGKWKKFLLFMRFNVFIMLCTIGLATAGPVLSQQANLDVSYTNVSLKTVLDDLKAKTGYHFFYFEEAVPASIHVTVVRSNATLEQVLDAILPANGLSYVIKEDIVTISRAEEKSSLSGSQSPPQQPVTLRGTIRDTEGNPIPGATVVVKDQPGVGTAADAQGRYTLRITEPRNTVLVISYLGKKSIEINYSGQAEISVTMEDDISEIGDVVVTGIFDRPRESYTGAVRTVSQQELKIFRGQNLLNTLRNIDPSINIIADNLAGANPNNLPQINIRGNSSLPASLDELNETSGRQLNAPLVIMDGFEISLQKLMDFNDEDIKTINILKDASSTAIYGSRGANGVIVITTKTPAEGKLRITLKAGLNLEIADLSSYDLLGAQDKLILERMVGLYDAPTSPDRDRTLKQLYNRRWSEALRGETDWLKEPVRVGVSENINLRLEGGNEDFRWGVTAGRRSVRGAMKGSERTNNSGAITLIYKYKNLTFKNQSNFDYTLADNGTYGKFSTYAKMNPYNRVKDENGDIIESWEGWSTDPIYNPIYDARLEGRDDSKTTALQNIFSIEWQVFEGFFVRGQLGLSKGFLKTDRYYPADHSMFKTSEYDFDSGNFFKRGSYYHSNGQDFSMETNVTVGYSKTFEDRHVLYTGLDLSANKSNSLSRYYRAVGYMNKNFNDWSNGLTYDPDSGPSGTDNRTARVGYTAYVNYTFDERYFADLSGRLDGSSQFGSDNRFAPFWSAGTGWNIHREKFMSGVRAVDIMRLRLSYGQTGSQQFSPYQSRMMYEFYNDERYLYWTGSGLLGLGNEELKWQKTNQWNIGLETQFLDRRLTFEVDLYHKKTSNLLSAIDIPRAHGFSSYVENIGKVENKGFEVMAGGYIIRNYERGINWMVTGRMAYTVNKILKLSDAIKNMNEQYLRNDANEYSTLLFEGHAQNSIYAVPSLGIDPIDGDEMYLDANGNVTKTWSPDARVYCGVAEPKFRGTISTYFSYGDFSLNVSFGYHWGGKQYNNTLIDKVEVPKIRWGENLSIYDNVDRRVLTDRWQKPGDVKFFKGISSDRTRSSTRFVMPDRAFELQSLNVQYRWHTPFVHNKLRAETVNISINMSDLFYISSIKRERGIEYPYARNVQMSISMVF